VSEATEVAPVVVDPVRAAIGERATEVIEAPDALVAMVERENVIDVLRVLRDDSDLGVVRLVDITAVDYLDRNQGKRFEVVYHVHSLALNRYVRVRVPVDEDDAVVPTATDVWIGANWFEREVYDLFGITFSGHPDLKRILLPDEWDGYPLRKDYVNTPEPIEFSFNPEKWQKAVQRGD
jgi:NADH-quinone oxidoreductase subunit C